MAGDPGPRFPDSKTCDLFWGSHGCDLPRDEPHTTHVCDSQAPDGVCSELRINGFWISTENGVVAEAEVRFRLYDEEGSSQWGEWRPNWHAFR